MNDEDPISEDPVSQEAKTARGLTYQQVEEQFPAAWAAMPECYQNDSCLTFYLKGMELQADYDLEPITFVWNGQWWRKQHARQR